MAWDEGFAQVLRDDLSGETFAERKMFGGLAFLLNCHMVCGVHKGGAMIRVGKDYYLQALSIPGVTPIQFTGRAMTGMVDVGGEAFADDATRRRLLDMALSTVRALPPKP